MHRSCGFCNELLPGGRRFYHEYCLPLARVLAQIEPRVCPSCDIEKPADCFAKDAKRVLGKFPYCLECTRERNKKPQGDGGLNGRNCPTCEIPIRGHMNRRFCSKKCKDKTKSLRRSFNLDIQDYKQMVANTGGICPLCSEPTTRWVVDHNHQTGEVTGVVCNGCNITSLVASRHDIERVKKLLAYLEKTPAATLGIVAIAPVEKVVESKLHTMWRPLH